MSLLKLIRNIPFYLFVIFYWLFVIEIVTMTSVYTTRGLLDFNDINWSKESNPVIYYLVSWNQFVESALFAIFLGILFILINELSETLHWDKFSFGKSLMYKSLLYIVGLVIIFALVYTILTNFGSVDPSIYNDASAALKYFKEVFLVMGIYLIFNIILLNFIVQNIQKTGRQNIISFLTGKYHRPIIEDRVFMFLDLKSSTSYAEKLGSIRYSTMLRDCFHDINHIVREYHAQIYQYVGDEIVLTWEWNKKKDHINFIDLYFAFKNRLESRRKYYNEKYGLLPVFKAGLHGGNVTVAEIGQIKRDIAFHGDVLNTTSRIQDLCNPLKASFLISDDLLSRIESKGNYLYKNLGEHLLRGKTKKVGLYAIEMPSI